MLILFYNCLTERGAKFRPLVEKLALLKHLDSDDLCSSEHAKFYAPSAYGGNDQKNAERPSLLTRLRARLPPSLKLRLVHSNGFNSPSIVGINSETVR